jgi:hypothetical protein
LALSITLKSFVICLLPFLIFGLLFSALYRLGRVASRTIFWILVLVLRRRSFVGSSTLFMA